MNLPANFPLKKVIITVVSVVIVIALIITGVTVAVNGKAANATVDVEQVSNISTQYWGDQSSTYGNATSDFVQELYPDKEKAISKIFVKEGDTVKIGDTLLQYDTTKLQLTVESKELEEKRRNTNWSRPKKNLRSSRIRRRMWSRLSRSPSRNPLPRRCRNRRQNCIRRLQSTRSRLKVPVRRKTRMSFFARKMLC